MQRKMTE